MPTTVTSLPLRLISATPSGTVYSPVGTGPLVKYSALCSRKMTGLSSRIADFNKPLASAGVDGVTTFRPGMWQNHASRLWLCWAALPRPARPPRASLSRTPVPVPPATPPPPPPPTPPPPPPPPHPPPPTLPDHNSL